MTRNVAVLVFDGFADWEPAFALAGLRRWGARTVVAVGYDSATVTSMGGLRVVPDETIERLDPTNTELLILPGGDAWLEGALRPGLQQILHTLVASAVPVAGICAATVALARAGLFEGRRHTSNGAAFLERHAPGYVTRALYTECLAVSDRGVITASGLGAVEFASEIFGVLGVFGADDRRQYLDMYRLGRSSPDVDG